MNVAAFTNYITCVHFFFFFFNTKYIEKVANFDRRLTFSFLKVKNNLPNLKIQNSKRHTFDLYYAFSFI